MLSSPGTAVAADPPLGEGVLLGPRLEVDPALRILAATSKYYLTDFGKPADGRPAPWNIRNVSDGSAAGEFARSATPSSRTLDVVGDYAVEWAEDVVEARKLGEAETQVFPVPTGAKIRNVYPGGLLLERGDDFVLRTYAGDETPVTGVGAAAQVLDRTDAEFLLGTATGLFVLDVATGTASEIAPLDAATNWAQLTPGRVIWQTAASDTSTTVAWKDRTGAATGTIVVPFKQPLVPLGDDVALRLPDTKELLKVNVVDGTVTRNVVTGVHDAKDQGNGRLLLTAQSQVASIGADGALQTIAQTPAFEGQVGSVGLSGNRVRTAGTDGHLYETSDLGTTWSQLPLDSYGNDVQFERDVVLRKRITASGVKESVLTDSKGDWALPNWDAWIGRGGKLIAVDDAPYPWFGVWDLAKRKSIGGYSRALSLNDNVQYHKPRTRETIDVIGKPPHQLQIDIKQGCGEARQLEVSGNWLVLDCINGPDQIIDLTKFGIPIRTTTLAPNWKLGNNFLIQEDGNQLRVSDLRTLNMPERRYGPVASSSRAAEYEVDDQDGGRLVYMDENHRPRLVTLDWLSPTMNYKSDKFAPQFISADVGPAQRTQANFRFTPVYEDPATEADPSSGINVLHIRNQIRLSPDAPFSEWSESPTRPEYPAIYSGPVGSTTCIQVMARDRANNLSEWSQSYCSERVAPPAG
ncbi:hypothetical protein E1263_27660 [Kribbella antibiotica]|uniref:Uncharacterized protein n=1 Tax=Kribbella antibiotica TaxID=190195 RepID=A0A4R4ZBR6_9ACTN|nr:hypothetical protein [Kribbella antibiotica]TDD53742.1 hypothetical protein E1263_27660 [Kribbella antibiotica]